MKKESFDQDEYAELCTQLDTYESYGGDIEIDAQTTKHEITADSNPPDPNEKVKKRRPLITGLDFFDPSIPEDKNKAFPCKYCDKSYRLNKLLKRHIKGAHPNLFDDYVKSIQLVQCDRCQRTFATPGYLLKHKRGTKCQFNGICTECGKVFTDFWSYKIHVQMTHLNAPIPCPECGKTYKNQMYLKKHIQKNHGNEKLCQFCHESFITMNKLKHHIYMQHTKDSERPFVCNVCGKGFGRRNNYEEHCRIHTKDKPFQCRVCDYATNSVGNRNKHEKQRHQYYHNDADTQMSSKLKT